MKKINLYYVFIFIINFFDSFALSQPKIDIFPPTIDGKESILNKHLNNTGKNASSESKQDNMAAITVGKNSILKSKKSNSYNNVYNHNLNNFSSQNTTNQANNSQNTAQDLDTNNTEDNTNLNENLNNEGNVAIKEEESSSSSIWKNIGIGVAAVGGAAALGTGLYFGVNALVDKFGNTNQDETITNIENNAENTLNIQQEANVFEKEEIDNIKTNMTIVDADLSNVKEHETPTNGEELSVKTEQANALKDTLNGYVERLPLTSSSLATSAVVIGGVAATGALHSDIIKSEIVDDVNKMAKLEEQMVVSKTEDIHHLSVEHDAAGRNVKWKVNDYIKKNDNRYNKKRNYRNDVYFDKPKYAHYSGRYIASHINYFPEFNIRKSENKFPSYDVETAIAKMDGSKSDPIEKEHIANIKDILETVHSGKSLTELQKVKLENALSGDTIRSIENNYQISLADHIGYAKNISDTDTRIKLKSEKEKSVFAKYLKTNDYAEKTNEESKINIANNENQEHESLKNKITTAMNKNEILPREIIHQIDDNKHVMKGNRNLQRYFEEQKQSVEILDKYHSSIERGNTRLADKIGEGILTNETMTKRVQSENMEAYNGMFNRQVSKDVRTMLNSEHLKKESLTTLHSNSAIMASIRTDPEVMALFNEKVDAYREMDKIEQKIKNGEKFSLEDYRMVIENDHKRKIIKNENTYQATEREILKKSHAISLSNDIVNAFRNGEEVSENHTHALFSNAEMIEVFKEIAPMKYYEMAEEAHVNNHHKIINASDYTKDTHDNLKNTHVDHGGIDASPLVYAKNFEETKMHLDKTEPEETVIETATANEEHNENNHQEEKGLLSSALSFFGFQNEEEFLDKMNAKEQNEENAKIPTDEEIRTYAKEDQYYDHEGIGYAHDENSIAKREEIYHNMYKHEETRADHSNIRHISRIRMSNNQE